ncbi:hypothetical protein Pmani_001667 [Petrolisthes manimaculis]|uniref:Uncharacterized protein n=1 Tax=Petrolisthes manimaculis TaxID=1843537 RepID=A0AAE1URA8_9EUCA|nr:hypothetical protein Pmani_001667 [Petrolisthes manimaculis]
MTPPHLLSCLSHQILLRPYSQEISPSKNDARKPMSKSSRDLSSRCTAITLKLVGLPFSRYEAEESLAST